LDIDLFDYTLPRELIALHPPARRDAGRLLVLDPLSEVLSHRRIAELGACLPEGALLVANDTRVVRARLRGTRPTGGAVELLLVQETGRDVERSEWLALGRANKPLRPGDEIAFGALTALVKGRRERGEVTVEFDRSSKEVRAEMAASGEVPLPPYIRRAPVPEDATRYQTIYARHDGSVAAPTAGLHFTDELVGELEHRGVEMVHVTLHVGPGTFRPVDVTDTDEHRMDAERFVIGDKSASRILAARKEGRPVIAVGTTVTRALEGRFAECGDLLPGTGSTELFITPGFQFQLVDGLLTNFHLPRSTLLCLVSALAGRKRIMAAYGEAVTRRYRFYSYGDAMLILPKKR